MPHPGLPHSGALPGLVAIAVIQSPCPSPSPGDCQPIAVVPESGSDAALPLTGATIVAVIAIAAHLRRKRLQDLYKDTQRVQP